jgi:hypothetical protein
VTGLLPPDDPWAAYANTVVEIVRRSERDVVTVRAGPAGRVGRWPWPTREPVPILTAWDRGEERPGVDVNRRLGPDLIAAVVAGALLGLATVWAHHLTFNQRYGELWYYSLALLAVSLVGGAALIVCTTSVWSVVGRLPLSGELTYRLSGVARLVFFLMPLVFAALVCWWVSEAVHAHGVLASGITAGVPVLSQNAPPMLLITGLLMVAGPSVAGVGVARIRRSTVGGPSTS